MSTNQKSPLPTQEQLSDDELGRLVESDNPEDWQKVEAFLDAEIAAMTPEERAELDERVVKMQRFVTELLESHGYKVVK